MTETNRLHENCSTYEGSLRCRRCKYLRAYDRKTYLARAKRTLEFSRNVYRKCEDFYFKFNNVYKSLEEKDFGTFNDGLKNYSFEGYVFTWLRKVKIITNALNYRRTDGYDNLEAVDGYDAGASEAFENYEMRVLDAIDSALENASLANIKVGYTHYAKNLAPQLNQYRDEDTKRSQVILQFEAVMIEFIDFLAVLEDACATMMDE